MLWIMTSVLLVAGAWLLTRIPLAGMLIFVFVLPIIASSSMVVVQETAGGEAQAIRRKQALKVRLQENLKNVARCLFGSLNNIEKLTSLISFSVLTLVIVLLVNILEELIAGPARLSSIGLLDAGFLPALQFLAVRTLSLAIYGFIVVMLFYAVPLHMLGDVPVFSAISHSIRACLKNSGAFFSFLGIIAGPFLFASIVSSVSSFYGITLMMVVGVVMFPVIVCSSFCSYRLVFN